jgi:streptogramin lyase
LNCLRIVSGCVLASLCLLCGSAGAQVITEFSAVITSGANPWVIASGPDGNLWFTEYTGNRIGRISTSGVVAEFNGCISGSAGLEYITRGPDNNLWFAEYTANRIGRITTGSVGAPPVLACAASRNVHGAAGAFDLRLSP